MKLLYQSVIQITHFCAQNVLKMYCFHKKCVFLQTFSVNSSKKKWKNWRKIKVKFEDNSYETKTRKKISTFDWIWLLFRSKIYCLRNVGEIHVTSHVVSAQLITRTAIRRGYFFLCEWTDIWSDSLLSLISCDKQAVPEWPKRKCFLIFIWFQVFETKIYWFWKTISKLFEYLIV